MFLFKRARGHRCSTLKSCPAFAQTMATKQATKNVITIKGSAEIVAEFFGYSVNSVLFQRGVYPTESFARVQKYGLGLYVTQDEELKRYITAVLGQMQDWLSSGTMKKMVLVISNVDDPEQVLERWTFDIQTDENSVNATAGGQQTSNSKSSKEINAEIAAIMRQIAASVTFLPLLEQACAFDLLVYTDKGVAVPIEWEESAARCIDNAQHVRLRSVDTSIHKVDTTVAYRVDA